jgi:Mg-chelatase subunit ChlD
MSGDPALRRWRLVLGRFAQDCLDHALSATDGRMDRALDHVYGRAYLQRGYRMRGQKGRGTLEPSQLSLPEFVREARRLFPESVFETIQAHALTRFGMAELLLDPEVAGSLTPSVELLAALLTFKGRASPEVREAIRQLARRVADDVTLRLNTTFARAMSGARTRSRASQSRALADFDWRRTLRANLRSWDPERQRLVAARLKFTGRGRRQLPWSIILCVDQSGSMASSVIYTALMAAILTGLPAVSLKLVVFDTQVVELTAKVADPVDVLMSVQLGGGTDIGQALEHCERLITQPARTVLVLLSDLCEGGSPGRLLRCVRRLAEARVTLLCLAALDDAGRADFDRGMAQEVASAGMRTAALTPDRFAVWLAGIIR